MNRLAITEEPGAGWSLDDGGLLGRASPEDHGLLGHREGDRGGLETRSAWTDKTRHSQRTMDRLAILRASVAGLTLDRDGIMGQACQTDHGPFGHMLGAGGDVGN